MRLSIAAGAQTRFLRAIAACLASLGLLMPAMAGLSYAKDGAIGLIVPGMNQTELQAVLGPPDFIQYNGLRQAWQYCPHFLERLRKRDGTFVETIERLIAREEGDLFITVWFTEGVIEHLRAYPEGSMGSCRDFYRAFRWEDNLEGAVFFEVRRFGK